MKPIPEQVADALPEIHNCFIEWAQSSKELQAAICQDDPLLSDKIKNCHEKLDAYLSAVLTEMARRKERTARDLQCRLLRLTQRNDVEPS
jgi:hypothetical protein